jgi:ankyrin repeat protein
VGGGVHHLDVNGATALHHATEQGQVGAVRMLISLGADVQAPDSQGDTALHVAASKGQVCVCSP